MSDITQLRPSWIRKIDVTRVAGCSVPGECWLWRGAHNKGTSYGRVTVDHKVLYLHRVVYEMLVGPIPDGLQIDHLCRQPACCAPHHLEPVTPLTNTRRGSRATQTRCKNAHPLSGGNVYVQVDSNGRPHRRCRTCYAAYRANWRAQRKARQAATWAKYLGTERQDVA